MMTLGVIDANDQLIEAELDGGLYHIGLSWNETGQLWTLSIRDLDRVTLASGLPVVPNFPLLRFVRRPEMPPGDLIAYMKPGGVLDRQSFVSGAASMVYLSLDDRAALAAQ